MNISDYLFEQGLAVIPLLNIIGKIIKETKFVSDRYIPVILLVIGISCAFGLMGISADSAIQGVLLTGTAVFGNQLVKQLGIMN
ncbi:MAG: phage holin family protein [Clostridia bacterium]|nr:phage holin family protein [Clostridia bacterium]